MSIIKMHTNLCQYLYPRIVRTSYRIGSYVISEVEIALHDDSLDNRCTTTYVQWALPKSMSVTKYLHSFVYALFECAIICECTMFCWCSLCYSFAHYCKGISLPYNPLNKLFPEWCLCLNCNWEWMKISLHYTCVIGNLCQIRKSV